MTILFHLVLKCDRKNDFVASTYKYLDQVAFEKSNFDTLFSKPT